MNQFNDIIENIYTTQGCGCTLFGINRDKVSLAKEIAHWLNIKDKATSGYEQRLVSYVIYNIIDYKFDWANTSPKWDKFIAQAYFTGKKLLDDIYTLQCYKNSTCRDVDNFLIEKLSKVNNKIVSYFINKPGFETEQNVDFLEKILKDLYGAS